MNPLNQHIIRVLKYYDYFAYPLTAEEIRQGLPVIENHETVQQTLMHLCAQSALFVNGPYYSLRPGTSPAEYREKANARAASMLPKALRNARFIAQFPFVRAVFISGSLSKNVADDSTDMDYFILTRPGTLWIARTLLHLFKKLTFITGHQEQFCMNYFIDTDHLRIEEESIYTATELITLKCNPEHESYRQAILIANSWIADYLPNQYKEQVDTRTTQVVLTPERHSPFVYQWLNCTLLKLTDTLWRKKWARRGFPMADYDQAFKSREWVSKNHPHNYFKKLNEYLN